MALMWILEQVLTEGHPLQWDLTFSSMIPTAASFPSTDLTTPLTSFPAASSGPASVPTNVSICLGGNCKWNLCPDQEWGSLLWRCLPGHHISRSRSAGVEGYCVRFFSHGGANETVFECEHGNRAGLPAHTQHLELDGTQSSSRTGVRGDARLCELARRPAYLAVHGESRLCCLACLQEFGSCHAVLVDLVRHCAPSRHVILFPGIRSNHTVGKQAENMTRQ